MVDLESIERDTERVFRNEIHAFLISMEYSTHTEFYFPSIVKKTKYIFLYFS